MKEFAWYCRSFPYWFAYKSTGSYGGKYEESFIRVREKTVVLECFPQIHSHCSSSPHALSATVTSTLPFHSSARLWRRSGLLSFIHYHTISIFLSGYCALGGNAEEEEAEEEGAPCLASDIRSRWDRDQTWEPNCTDGIMSSLYMGNDPVLFTTNVFITFFFKKRYKALLNSCTLYVHMMLLPLHIVRGSVN